MNSIERLNKVTLILGFLLGVIILASMSYTIYNTYEKRRYIILEQAKNAFSKNLNFRRWIAMHGGIYVFPDEKTPPNPYLKDHPDRDLETTDGRKLTLMNPAYSLRQMLENFKGRFNEEGHITSLKPLNPKNIPDKWEEKALKKFANNETTEFHEFYDYKGSEHLRYMQVLKTEAECLHCHASQGYTLGSVRGGISITIPMSSYNQQTYGEIKDIIIFHVFALTALYILIFLIYRHMRNSIFEEQRLITQLASKDQMLFKQSKIASLGEMLNNIAHHWRQPLSIISTSASGVKLQNEFKTITPQMIDKSMEEIINATTYLSQTIEDFTKLIDEHSQKTEFNASEHLLNDIHIFKANSQNPNIELKIDIEPQIQMKNYKYAFTKAVLYIFSYLQMLFEKSEVSPKILSIGLKQVQNNVVITIQENTGCIDEEAIKKLFEPNITSKYNYQTNSLNLFLAFKLICENLNGCITAEHASTLHDNKELGGVCFTITLPLENKE